MVKITDIRILVRGIVPTQNRESSIPWKGHSCSKRNVEMNRREVLIPLDIGIEPGSHKPQGNQHVKIDTTDVQREHLPCGLSDIQGKIPFRIFQIILETQLHLQIGLPYQVSHILSRKILSMYLKLSHMIMIFEPNREPLSEMTHRF